MKIIKTISFSLALLIIPSFVLGASFASNHSNHIPKSSTIPKDVRNLIPDKDWVELYSYEAKAKGGEAIAKIQALEELIAPLIESSKEFGVEVELPDYQNIIKELENKLNLISGETTLEGAENKLNDFISYANTIKSQLTNNNLKEKIEPKLKAKGKELRAKLEKEMKGLAEKLKQESEKTLRAQAEKEAQEIGARLRKSIKADIEKDLIAEFKAYKSQVGNDEGLLKAFVEKLKKKGPKIGEERGKEMAKIERTKLTEKYEKLALKEKERITKELNDKADTIAGVEKKKLENIRDGFLSLVSNLDSLSQKKMGPWNIFKDKAIAKRKEILIKIMGDKIEKAKELIMSHKEEIDEAIKNGQDIPSAEKLVSQLEANKIAMINDLSSGQLDELKINEAVENFKSKWNGIRVNLEKMKDQSNKEIYNMIKSRLEQAGFNQSFISSLDPNEGSFQEANHYYLRWKLWCRYDVRSRNYNPSYIPLSDLFKEQFCFASGGTRYYGVKMKNYASELGNDLAIGSKLEKEAFSKLKEFQNYNDKSDTSSLLKYKEELIKSLNAYKLEYKKFKHTYPSAKYLIDQMEVISTPAENRL